MNSQKFQISVRGLVEFVYRSGHLDMRFQSKSKMADGIKIHQKIQKSQGIDYQAEVTLQKNILIEDNSGSVELLVNGRADGILETDEGFIIDEIKGTSQFLEEIEVDTHPLHWAQAKIYGAIYSEQNDLEEIQIQLTYAHFESNEIKRLRQRFTRDELMQFLHDTVKLYKKWLFFKRDWKLKRDSSLDILEFPFDNYRAGQRPLAVSIYNTIKDGGVLYAEAPTGTGKTMSTLFPSIKSMSQGFVDRIFYLSAKTITKVVAEEAIELLYSSSAGKMRLKALTLTAKEKICLNEKVTCYPEKCPYALSYFDKSLDALWDIIVNERTFNKDIIIK